MTRTIITSALALVFVAGAALAQPGVPLTVDQTAANNAAGMMSRYDTDKDGKITQKEYMAGGAAAEAFARNDTNKDGVITAEELQAVLRPTAAAFDGNKDGVITNEEILAFMRANAPGAAPAIARPGIASETLELAGASRKITLYVPKSLPQKTAVPLLLTFHGAGQKSLSVVDPWTGLADTEGFIVVGMDATYPAWRMPTDGPDAVKALVDALRKRYSIDESRVYVFGHSSGAGFGLKLGVMESEYFAAVAVHAGQLDPATIQLLPQAKRKTPFKIISGDRDETVPLEGVNKTAVAIKAAGFPVDLEVIAGHDHNYYVEARDFNKKAWQFLKGHKLASPPKWVQHIFPPDVPSQAASTATPLPPGTAPNKFTSTETLVATLLADPEASAILKKHSRLFQNPLFSGSKTTGAMTLKQLQKEAPNQLGDDVLMAIDADLAKLSEQKSP